MIRLIVIVLVAALGWSGYWAVASTGLRKGIDAALASAAQQGWAVTTADLTVRGFPSRIDTVADTVEVTPPSGAFTWRAPHLEVLALSYRPNKLIVVWPETQSFDTPQGTATLRADDLRANVDAAAATDLPLQAITFVAENPTLQIQEMQAGAAALRIATLRMGDTPERHKLGIEMLNTALPGTGPLIDRIWVDGALEFDAPLDRHLGATQPQLQSIENLKAQVQWGDARAELSGSLNVVRGGLMDGTVEIDIVNWGRMLNQLADAGAVRPQDLPQLKQTLGLLSGGSDRLQLPVTLRQGTAYVGPIAIGSVPPLRLR